MVGVACSLAAQGQNPLFSYSPDVIYDQMIRFDSVIVPFGVGLGPVDSMVTRFPDEAALVLRYLVSEQATQQTITSTTSVGDTVLEQRVTTIPKVAPSDGVDLVKETFTFLFNSEQAVVSYSLKRHFSSGRLDSLLEDITSNLFGSGSSRTLYGYRGDTTRITKFETFNNEPEQLNRHLLRVKSASSPLQYLESYEHDFDIDTLALDYQIFATSPTNRDSLLSAYLYVSPRNGRIDLVILGIDEVSRYYAADEIAVDNLLLRSDDGSNSRLRRYIRRGASNLVQEDSYYYRSPLFSSAKELPLLQSTITGPNPIHAGQTLQLEPQNAATTLTIFDSAGRTVLQQMLHGTEQLLWPTLPTGPYVISMQAPGYQSRGWTWMVR